jgi:hypothetical protein
MKIVTETMLQEFKFWLGAKDTMETLEILEDRLNEEDYAIHGDIWGEWHPRNIWQELEAMLEDTYDGWLTDCQLNDFFWFDRDTIAEWLGFQDWKELEEYATA